MKTAAASGTGDVEAEQGKKARAAEETEEQKAARLIELNRKAQEQMAAKEAALKAAEETTKAATKAAAKGGQKS